MKNKAILQTIEHDRALTENGQSHESDREFLFAYQRAVLLALKEMGTLNEMQYRYAQNRLNNQHRTVIKEKTLWHNRAGGAEK